MARTAEPSYYDILGVAPTASAGDIEAAWRRLALIHHPDRAAPKDKAQATSRMAIINNAYSTLCDPGRRAHYDERRPMSPAGFSVNPDAALDALVRMRTRRRVQRLQTVGAATAGVGAIGYSIYRLIRSPVSRQ